jgi:hypothetical protein
MAITKQEDLEKAIFKDANKLIIGEDEEVTAIIIDDELDPIVCRFNYDGCVELDTTDYTYLSLSFENLKMLQKLLLKAEKHFDSKYAKNK